jgi:FkbM family methyltransferase
MRVIKQIIKDLAQKLIPSITVTCDNIKISGRPHDYGFLKAVARGQREPFMYELFKKYLAQSKHVVDVGAHLGHYSILAAKQLGQEGKVTSFEADPDTFKFLTKNRTQNSVTNNLEIHHLAISAEDVSEVTFYRDIYQPDFSSMASHRSNAKLEKVTLKSVSIDKFFAGKNIDLIKMDIEGAEVLALTGAKKTLSAPQKPVIFIESNPSALEKFETSAKALHELLVSYGYKVSVIDENLKELRPLSPSDYQECQNLLCTAQ